MDFVQLGLFQMHVLLQVFFPALDLLKHDLNRCTNELEAYKTKYESIESREKDLQHYLNIIKEALSTKEQQIAIINSEWENENIYVREWNLLFP